MKTVFSSLGSDMKNLGAQVGVCRRARGAGRLAAVVVSLAAMAGQAQAADSIRVACNLKAAWCEAMAKAFQASSGVAVEMVIKTSGESYAALKAERDKPTFDVWWGGAGDPQLQAAEEGLTHSYKSPITSELNGWAQRFAWVSGYRSVGVFTGVLGFSYNPELLAAKKLPEPACWDDLIKPEYKGLVQVADARLSGTAYTFLATLVQLKGETAAFDYVKQLHPNIATYTRTGAAPAKAVADGKATIGISFLSMAMTHLAKGAPVKLVAPCEGTGYETGAMSIVKGAPNLAGAKRFFDYALSPAAQELGATLDEYQTPANRAANPPSNVPSMGQVKLIKYDVARYGSSAERKRLLAKWQQTLDLPNLP